MSVLSEKDGPVTIITINRPAVRNAVNRSTADALAEAFRAFESDADAVAGVLTGADGNFCAGADLKSVSAVDDEVNRLSSTGDAPMGPSRMVLSKPMIAAVEGYAVAGGLELALFCDMRVAGADAVFGVFCRRWGVPLIDGGTIRLPRLIGMSRAIDMILTGRQVRADEAQSMGLANRVVPTGTALAEAVALAKQISAFPRNCMLSDRQSAYEQWSMNFEAAMENEFRLGMATIQSGETVSGAGRFSKGAGRYGKF
ncbi:MAG: crotonase/enoyl-CoA hydratase family protein [Thermodesulfobacteriota bacterium]|nr:crotonase/enoyl-CoA hydratase family protein [Thermodesulfobacteriota bacterium]